MNNNKAKSGKKRSNEVIDNSTNSSNANSVSKAEQAIGPKGSKKLTQEIDFPRGGGAGITPLEFKEVSRKANQDLFNESKSSNSKKRKLSSKKPKTADTSEESITNQIEDKAEKLYKELSPLTFKRVLKGSKSLGVVTKIGELGLTVSLPNHLTGHVPITQISREFTQILESFTEGRMESEDQDDEFVSQPGNSIDLAEIFHLGQFVKCSVTLASEKVSKPQHGKQDGSKAKSSSPKVEKKIELSLEPEEVNKGLDAADICESMVLAASVVSLEDHGYRLNIGIEEMQGFLSYDNSDSFLKSNDNTENGQTDSKLKVGQVIMASVASLNKNSGSQKTRVIQFTLDPKIISKNSISDTLQSIYSVQPGSIIDALVIRIGEKGAVMQFMGFYDCTATLTSLTNKYSSTPDQILSKIKLGDKVRARITYASLSTTNKTIMVSTAQHILSMSVPKWNRKPDSTSEAQKTPASDFDYWWPQKFGSVIDAKVIKTDNKSGVYFEIPVEGTKVASAYASLGNITNSDNPSDIPKAISSLSPQSETAARVIGYSPMENCALVSLKKSVIEEEYFQLDDVVLGKKVKCTIEKVLDNGIIVSLSRYITSFVSADNLSDVKLTKIEKKFQEGDKVTGRVFAIKSDQKKVYLTLRRSLVDSTLPIISSYDSATVGEVSVGIVRKLIQGSGAIVSFYQNFSGFLPIGEINGNYITNINSFLRVGQFIKVKVLKKDDTTSRVLLTCRMDVNPQEKATAINTDNKSIVIGSVFEESIVEFINEASVGLRLQPSNNLALLSINHLSDHFGNPVDKIKDTIFKDKPLGLPVTVLENKSTGIVVSAKPLLVYAAKEKHIVKDASSCKVGSIEAGFVSQITKFGVFVKFFGGYSGLATINSISDHYVSSAESEFQNGQTVLAKIISVDADTNKVSLSLKPSQVEMIKAGADDSFWNTEPNQIFVEQLFSTETSIQKSLGNNDILDLSSEYNKSLGSLIDVKINQVHSYGWMVSPITTEKTSFFEGASGFICIEQVADYVKDQKADHKSYVGKVVTARIIDADYKKKVLDLSLKPSQTNKAKNSTKNSTKNKKSTLKKVEELSTKKSIIEVLIELVKEDHLVLSIPSCNSALAYSCSKTLNLRAKPFVRYKIGQRLKGKVILVEELGRTLCTIAHNSELDVMDAVKRVAKNPVDPSINYFEDYQPGKSTKAKVVSILPNKLTAKLVLSDNIKAKMMITELTGSTKKDQDLFSQYSVTPGSIIDVTIIGVHSASNSNYLPITKKVNPAKVALDVSLTKVGTGKQRSLEFSQIKSDSTLTGVIYGVDNTRYGGVWIAFNERLKTKIPLTKISSNYEVISKLTKYFVIGSPVEVRVINIDAKKEKLSCLFTERELSTRKVPLPPRNLKEIKAGDFLAGFSIKYTETNGITVAINLLDNKHSSEAFGRVSLVDICDDYTLIKSFVKKNATKDSLLKVKVIKVDRANKKLELSTRESSFNNKINDITDPQIASLDNLNVGKQLNGFIKSVSNNGIFVLVGSSNLTGRVKLSEISEEFVKNPEDKYEVGAMVKVSVLKVDQKQNQIELSMRAAKPLVKLSEGDIVKGSVTKTSKSGIFIMIYDTFKQKKIVCLCPIDEIADTKDISATELLSHYNPGDKVLAKIISIDDKSRMILSLKSSNFVQSNNKDSDSNDIEMSNDESDGESSSESTSVKQNDETDLEEGADSSDNGSDEEDHEDEEDDELVADINPLDVDGGFSWSNNTEGDHMDIDPADDIFGIEDNSEDEQATEKQAKKPKSKKQQSFIEDVTAEMGDKQPATVEEFERLLVASPDSSYLWVSYMAFYCDLGEIEMARKVCDRGIEKISFRLEQEKMNLYIARMNLECKFGSQTELEKIVQKALQYNNPKHIYLQLARIYFSNNDMERAAETFQIVAKKFKTSCKVWLQYFEFCLKNDLNSGDLMKRSLICLPKRKHIKAITKFAQLEFKYSHQERARTIFENLLSNYPNRSDLWNVYLDLEVKNLTKNNLDGEADIFLVHNLFTRVISLKFNPRNKKNFFKKWLEFEKNFGTEEGVQNVKNRAFEYVQSNQ